MAPGMGERSSFAPLGPDHAAAPDRVRSWETLTEMGGAGLATSGAGSVGTAVAAPWPATFLDWPPRLALYKTLATGFGYPGDSLVALLRRGDLVATVRNAEETTGYGLVAAPGLAGEYSLEELEVAYSHYFDIGWKHPPCPPYGGLYANRNGRQMLLWELVQFYRHFGLAVSPAVKELPDHISVGLEFMYYLVFKEYHAVETESLEDWEGYRRAQSDFLARYLWRWVPGFTARVVEKCSHSFYRDLAALLQQWVAGEERNFSREV